MKIIFSLFLIYLILDYHLFAQVDSKKSDPKIQAEKMEKEIKTLSKKDIIISGKIEIEKIGMQKGNSLDNNKKVEGSEINDNNEGGGKKENSNMNDHELEKEKKRAEWIEKTIEFSTHKERKRAIDYILTIKNKELKTRLQEKLITIISDESDSEVKIKAITVAGELKLKESVPTIQNSLDDESEDVKIAAVYSLKTIGDHSAKQILIEKLQGQTLEKNSTYTEALINTLADFKAIELQKFAIDAILNDKTTRNIRELFVLFLGKIESKESKDTLIKLLKDDEEDKGIRAFAANSLAYLGITEASNEINDVIKKIESYPYKKKKKYYNLYIYCIAALAKLGDERAIPRLIDSLRSDNPIVRIRGIKLIKELKDERTIDILKYKMNYDPSQKVQKAAKEALKAIGIDIEREDQAEKKELSPKSGK